MPRLSAKNEEGWVPQPPRMWQTTPSRIEFDFGLDVSREGARNCARGGRGTPRRFLRKSLQLLTIPQGVNPKGHGRLARDRKSITGETPVTPDQTSPLDSARQFPHHIRSGHLEKLLTTFFH